MVETGTNDDVQDPATEFPARFNNEFIAALGLVLLAFLGVGSFWLRDIFSDAGLFDKGEDAVANVAGFVLLVAGLLAIFSGLLFAFVEARRPKRAAATGAPMGLRFDLFQSEGRIVAAPVATLNDTIDAFGPPDVTGAARHRLRLHRAGRRRIGARRRVAW